MLPLRDIYAVAKTLTAQTERSHAWLAMEIETKFLRLGKPALIGDRVDGWRVCWVGGWDKCRVVCVVMVERRARPGPADDDYESIRCTIEP